MPSSSRVSSQSPTLTRVALALGPHSTSLAVHQSIVNLAGLFFLDYGFPAGMWNPGDPDELRWKNYALSLGASYEDYEHNRQSQQRLSWLTRGSTVSLLHYNVQTDKHSLGTIPCYTLP